MQFTLNEDGSIYARTAQGEIKFRLPAPFMVDSNGQYSDKVYYELEESGKGMVELTVVADSTWINTQAQFPVTIDPIIESYTETDFSYVNVYENGNKTTSGNIYVGKKDGVMSHAFLSFEVGSKGSFYSLVDATLNFTYGIGNNRNVYCDLYTFSNDVEFSSITYSNRPQKLETLDNIQRTALFEPDEANYSTLMRASNIQYDKLKVGIECLDGTKSGGYIVLTPSGEYVPSINLRYKYLSGIEDDYSMETFAVNGATAYVNNATGMLTVNCDLASINTMGSLPFQTSLVYNRFYDTILSEWEISDNRFGKNFKLNFQQYVRMHEVGVYQLLDADGSIINFYELYPSANVYEAYSKDLSLHVNGTQITVTDAQENQMIFENGRLRKIVPASTIVNETSITGEYISIDYYENSSSDANLIKSINYHDHTANILAKIQFEYLSQQVKVTSIYKSMNLMQYELGIDDSGHLTYIKNVQENTNKLTLEYELSSDGQLLAVFDNLKEGLYFPANSTDERIWKIISIQGKNYRHTSTRFYDYVEFNYSNFSTTKVLYYTSSTELAGEKYIAFNKARQVISEWSVDSKEYITVSNVGNWQAVWGKSYPNYEQESYLFSEKLNTSITGTNEIESMGTLEGTINNTQGIPTNISYHKYAFSFKVSSPYTINLTVNVGNIERQVELFNGGELYVSIPCNYLYPGTGFEFYNNSNQPIKISNVSFGAISYAKTTKTYDEDDNLSVSESITYSLNGEYAKYSYDTIERLTKVKTQSVTDTELITTEYTYNSLSEWGNRNEDDYYGFDIREVRKIEKKASDGSLLLSKEYDYNGSSQTATTSSNNVSIRSVLSQTRTGNNIIIEETDANNSTIKKHYAPVSGDIRLVKVEYNQINANTGVIEGKTFEEYSYNYWGQVTQINIYNEKVVGAQNQRTDLYSQSNVYDGAIYSYTIYNGDTYEYVRESKTGIVQTIEYNGNNMLTYTYDAPNHQDDTKSLKEVSYANGHVESYIYGPNKIQIQHRTSAQSTSNSTHEYILNSRGDIIEQKVLENSELKISYNYSESENGQNANLNIFGLEYGVDYYVTYDKAGRIKNTTIMSATSCREGNSLSSTYKYNGKGQIETISTSAYSMDLSYDEFGRIIETETDTQNNRYEYKTYGERYTTHLLTLIDDQTYEDNDCTATYDANGYVTSISYNRQNYSYSYDLLGRLSSETINGTTKTYAYDTKNNVQKTGLTYTNGKLTAVNGAQIVYDAMGNPIVYKGNTFNWEQGRKLVSGTLNGHSFAYNYDGNGMRYEKKVNGVRTCYYYNGTQLLMESKNGKRTWYIYGVTGIEGMITEGEYFNTVYYFDKNTLGDIIAIRNEGGNIIATYSYDAWGNCTVMDEDGWTNTSQNFIGNINPFRYRGYYFDDETGFYYLQTRYYDPTICRFINADNYELVSTLSSTPGQLNMYAYCNNNPIMYTDETGEGILAFLVVVGISALLGAIDGGVTAVVAEQDFWKGAAAGAIGGAVGGMIGFLSGGTPVGSLIARGVSSSIYNLGNEFFQTGTLTTNNLGLYAADVMMDVTYSLLYVGYFSGFSNQFLSTFLGGTTDSIIDIIQTPLFFSPTAQRRIRQGN